MGGIGDTSEWDDRLGPFIKEPFHTGPPLNIKGHYKFTDFRPRVRPQEEVTRQVMQFLAADHESKVRAALIELGWTPPPE